MVQHAHEVNPALPIFARSHSDEETAHLLEHGAREVIMGENESAKAMVALIGERDAAVVAAG